MPRKRAQLRHRLDPRRWALTGEVTQLDAAQVTDLNLTLSGRACRAGEREGELGERVDEGELGEIGWVWPGEAYHDSLRGCVVVGVHLRGGTSATWVYADGAALELPDLVEDLGEEAAA